MPELTIATILTAMLLVGAWSVPSHLMSNLELLGRRTAEQGVRRTVLISRTAMLVGGGTTTGWALTDSHVPALAKLAMVLCAIVAVGWYSSRAAQHWMPEMTSRWLRISFMLGLVLAFWASGMANTAVSAILVASIALHFVLIRPDGTRRVT